ncbi:MAG TPA: hypothetical protein VFY28_00400 [Candidatus Paceibacterota bacterium]|nr:hypothetical protein [Candidatus Paceibacterota bacterium]
MSVANVSVSHAIPLRTKVLQWLDSQGEDTEDTVGGTIYLLTASSEPRKFLWWSWMHCRRLVIAQIHFDDKGLKAVPSKNWVIDVYGEDHLETVKDMAGKLSSKFNVKVHIRLLHENAFSAAELYHND